MRNPTSNRGFAAIAAVFLVVGLAALGAFLVSISNTQQITSTQDLQGTRAYWAARAGLEWGMTAANATAACGTTTLTIPATAPNFTVVVTCTSQPYTEGVLPFNIFQITALATSGTLGNVGYIERSVSASLER
jgi:MSHA biogenesis protein MshP